MGGRLVKGREVILRDSTDTSKVVKVKLLNHIGNTTIVDGGAGFRVGDKFFVKATANSIPIQVSKLQSGEIDAEGDHRVAMAFAVASLRAEGVITIDNGAEIDEDIIRDNKSLISMNIKSDKLMDLFIHTKKTSEATVPLDDCIFNFIPHFIFFYYFCFIFFFA